MTDGAGGLLDNNVIMFNFTGNSKSEGALALRPGRESLKGRRGGGRIVIGYWLLPKAERRAEGAGRGRRGGLLTK